MVLGPNGVVWMEGGGGGAVSPQQQLQHHQEDDEEDAVSSWTGNNNNNNNELEGKEEDMGMNGSLCSFKSMLETDWYVPSAAAAAAAPAAMTTSHHQHDHQFHGLQQNHQELKDLAFCSNPPQESLLLQPMDSSSSCSPSQAFNLDPCQSQSHTQQSLLNLQRPCFSSLLNFSSSSNNNNNPFENGFDLGCETSFLGQYQQNQGGVLMGFGGHEFQPTQLLHLPDTSAALGGSGGGFGALGFEGFDGSPGNSLFLNRAKVLRPLEVVHPLGSQPTLFQKRAMFRQSSGGGGGDKLENLEISGLRFGGEIVGNWGNFERKRNKSEEGEIDEASFNLSGLNYDSDDQNGEGRMEESVQNNGGSNSNANSTVTGGGVGDQKGKKKGMPAKNLMAERRRRKKLNDRLYMLRSVVPRISKMDRASILGDAIDYLKELLQRINDLHNELESTPPGSMPPPSSSFHPLTPTPPTLPCRVKEEISHSSFPSPKNQTAKVEVKVREGRAVNIHMFCARRPGLLLSTLRALDNLGLDIQQAVISCFNGFALDVFRAEQCREGQDILPEQIKAVLLDSAGFFTG